MTGAVAEHTLDSLLARVGGLVERAGDLPGRRVLLGIAGPPGAGKSTLAAELVARLGPDAVLVPQDGFHLAQRQLDDLHRAERKGALDTFDAAGFVHLLRRLREPEPDGGPVYAPAFERALEEPVAGAIRVDDGTRVVIVEGNYLLLDEHGWSGVRDLLDECWYLDPPPEVRVPRLVRRHESYGRTPDQARAWVDAVDETNARLVAQSRSRATMCLQDWR